MLKKNSAPAREQIQELSLIQSGQIKVPKNIAKLVVGKTPAEIVALIQKERENVKRALELSEIDDITELLLNKRGWRRRTMLLCKKLARKNSPFAIFFVDLDRLKAVDEAFTHQHGTVYIQIFADVLDKTLRKKDIKSHPQGDEFFVFLPDVTKEEAIALKEKVLERFNEVIATLPKNHFFYNVPNVVEVGASIGIANKEWTDDERQELLSGKNSEIEKKIKGVVREVLKDADDDASLVKKKKRVVRDELKKQKRVKSLYLLPTKLRIFKSMTTLI